MFSKYFTAALILSEPSPPFTENKIYFLSIYPYLSYLRHVPVNLNLIVTTPEVGGVTSTYSLTYSWIVTVGHEATLGS